MTKSTFFVILLLSLFAACNTSEPTVNTITIIPVPVKITPGSGMFRWNESVTIGTGDQGKKAAQFLSDFLTTKKIPSTLTSPEADGNQVTLSIIQNDELKKEGYTLSVDDTGVAISANTDAGLFYGVQSLIQLISADGKEVAKAQITDYPRFSYRGLHLDVCRHMFPVSFVKKYIDLMARHKFNRFHWHLTEDQGWRIEIKKYPKLQEIAAYRNETLIGHAHDKPEKFDGTRYGGFYTQEEIKEVIQYAADRYVTIVPEIEMPGHAQAALSAYSELGCTGGPYTAATKWGVFENVYCAGKEETFKFLEGVIDEVAELFPGEYIHVGGDECPKTSWEKCKHCQKRMKAEGLKDEHELQSYFVQRMEKYINSKGKKIIGWDEILEGGLAPNATVMSWRGEEGGIAAAKQSHDVIMTPENWCYLDHYQDTSKTEPLAIGNYTPISEVYSYEPLPPQLSEAETKFILGAQGNVWTEYIATPEHVEYMVYPRACALAEVVWSSKESRNYENFLQRMETHFNRLDDWNVNYAKHIKGQKK
ncbi:MAG TPA: beta-N-acetylhexosaminidase [Cyclobacteriaceae bacterium]